MVSAFAAMTFERDLKPTTLPIRYKSSPFTSWYLGDYGFCTSLQLTASSLVLWNERLEIIKIASDSAVAASFRPDALSETTMRDIAIMILMRSSSMTSLTSPAFPALCGHLLASCSPCAPVGVANTARLGNHDLTDKLHVSFTVGCCASPLPLLKDSQVWRPRLSRERPR